MDRAEIILLAVIVFMIVAVAALKGINFWMERHKKPGWCLSGSHHGSNTNVDDVTEEGSDERTWPSISDPLLAYIKCVDDDRFVGPELVIGEDKQDRQENVHRLSAYSDSPLSDNDDYAAGTQITRTKLSPAAYELRPRLDNNGHATELTVPAHERLSLAVERGP